MEQRSSPGAKISRPRQIYTGSAARPWVPLEKR
jgi:citrate synthase